MSHPIDDCYVNLRRASEHFDTLHAEIVEWQKVHQAHAVISVEPFTGDELINVTNVPPLPPEWGALVGEIIYNLRAGLDYLVYELALQGGGNPEVERTEFPISDDPIKYLAVKGRTRRTYRDVCLAGVSERWKDEIDKLQPYQPGTGRRELLALNFLSNRSKHKTGALVRMRLTTRRCVVIYPGGDVVRGFMLRFRNFRDFGQMYVDAVTPGRSTEVVTIIKKHPNEQELDFTVAFGATPPVTLFQIKQIITATQEIIARFWDAFTPPYTP